MKKIFVCIFGVCLVTSAYSASSNHTMSGKVKSFDAKTVKIEVDGHVMEFNIARVIDKKNLRVGQTVEIDLDRKVSQK